MTEATDSLRPRVTGLHHLRLPVSNLSISIAWYERVLGGRRVPALDHLNATGARFASILQMSDWSPSLYLELRQSSTGVRSLGRGWDFVTLTVEAKEDLERWQKWLDRWGTKRSEVLVGRRGWILVFEDPDGRRIRLYTKEKHNGKEEPSWDEGWLGEG